MNYIVIEEFNKDKLEEKVNKKIKEGYAPIGGISTLKGKWIDLGARYFYQTMILECPIFLECPDCGFKMEELIEDLFSCTNEDCCNQITKLK